MVYYLTLKDSAIDKAINDPDFTIDNSAEWEGHTGDVSFKYNYPGVDKEILTKDADLRKIDEDIYAEFRIVANPSARTLNGGQSLELVDTAENLIIDVDSISVSDPQVTYRPNGNAMIYTIPDGKRIEITYKAKVEFKSIGQQGDNVKVDFNNTVEMGTYKDKVEKTATRQNRGTGAASVPQINLLKYEAGDITDALAGAQFELLDENKEAVTDKNGKPVTFVTGESGKLNVRGDMEKLGWVIEENKTYYLHETDAPDGHLLTERYLAFNISDDGASDHDNDIYASGDTISEKNYPVTEEEISKVWSDGNEQHEDDVITLQLQQKIGDGEWSDVIRMPDEDGNWADLESVTYDCAAEDDWTCKFTDLPAMVPTGENFDGDDEAVEYRIREIAVNGKEKEPVIGDSRYKETTYDVEDDKTTVTNVYVPDIEITLEAQKKFEHGVLDEDAMFTFEAYEVTGTDKSGKKELKQVASAETKATGKSTGKAAFTPIEYTLDDLANGDGTYADSRTFTYVLREDVPATADKSGLDSETNIRYDTEDKSVKVVLKLVDNKLKAEVDYGGSDQAVFTNTKVPPEESEESLSATSPKGPGAPGTGDDAAPLAALALAAAALIAAAAVRRKRAQGR